MTTEKDDKIRGAGGLLEGTGLISYPIAWLEKFKIPYKMENLERIKDKAGKTTAFKVLVDRDGMLDKYAPPVVSSGKIYITFEGLV